MRLFALLSTGMPIAAGLKMRTHLPVFPPLYLAIRNPTLHVKYVLSGWGGQLQINTLQGLLIIGNTYLRNRIANMKRLSIHPFGSIWKVACV
jgi:hypothetical protein